jgi:cell division protein FtsL
MRKNKIKIPFIEVFLWGIVVLLLLAIPMTSVYVKAVLSETNIALQSAKDDLEKQANTNEGLKMEINELASLDKIQLVANENGLSYNNNNVIVVEQDKEK